MNEKLTSVLERMKRYWREVDAQDLVEYALLLLVVALGTIASVKSLGTTVKGAFTNSTTQLVSNVGAAASVATGSTSAAADNAAAGANENLSTSYANSAASALATGNIAAAVDYAAAAASLSNVGIFGIGGAAYDDAQAAGTGTTTGANRDIAAANAAIAAAQGFVAAALAALTGGR